MSTASVYKTTVKVIGCCAFLLVLAVTAKAQQIQERGRVEVIKDPLVDTLMARWPQLIKGGPAVTSKRGYRIQIFSGSNRNSAYGAQNRFQQMYPGMRTYISYRDPNFKVKAGDFRTRLEAQKILQELQPYFSGMFIIAETINPPKLEPTP